MMPCLELAQGELAEMAGDVRALGHAPLATTLGRTSEHIGMASTAAQSMREIIRGMELSNRRQDSHRSTDLAEVVRLTLRMLRSQAMNRAQIVVEDGGAAKVMGTPTEIGQVLLNLLVNAIQAMPDRPLRSNEIVIKLGPGRAGEVVLDVRDNGNGIPADVLPRIFDPFYSTKAQGGTGLGLAISRKIVEESGGRMEVQSEPGKGTRFIVTLRAAAEGSTPPPFKT
jgi:signal transduction histidine kinase